jgi:hypothetical protein
VKSTLKQNSSSDIAEIQELLQWLRARCSGTILRSLIRQ